MLKEREILLLNNFSRHKVLLLRVVRAVGIIWKILGIYILIRWNSQKIASVNTIFICSPRTKEIGNQSNTESILRVMFLFNHI